MKRLFILGLILIFSIKSEAQINLSIKELNIFHLNIIIDKDKYAEDDEDGPYIACLLTFENVTDSSIFIYPSSSTTKILFSYKGEQYSNETFHLGFLENDTIKIEPKQSIEVNFGDNILLGMGLVEDISKDYSKELLQILPTIRVVYKDSKYNIKSVGILNVNIK